MKSQHHICLTASEIGGLWTTYINDTFSSCVLSYFLNIVEDTQIKPAIEYAFDISEQHIRKLTSIFEDENFPVPQGFTDDDVNRNAKRLYSDHFYLYYLKNMSKVGLATYSLAFSMCSRSDIRAFFHEALTRTVALDQKVTSLLQSKGLYIRPPYISVPNHIDFVESKSFLSGGFFGFGEKRPLTSIEIAHLFENSQTNSLGEALLLGFSQVVRSNEIRKYITRGVEISRKHIEYFDKTLKDDNLPVPMTWATDVTDSVEPPFSDKLILFHVSVLVAAGTGNYGVAASASPRKDVAMNYVRLAAEIARYAEDGAKLMIEHGWLEEPPQALNRKELTTR
ncbi:DUF3231 family protein [Paenibacillus sp. N4]|uniref:DUF3231 family protein n=1 Tax=Paenibacillus vietnamensis TaxID=2590547 RepID=UPI001CD158F8|nr:DUF3231 family protein [Paenibacillus vietnamensis]MCA0753984.1 DUF3231 family protein [Paenibacillus vietnamensis]